MTIHYHDTNPQMQVEVILASRSLASADAPPIYTLRLRYPRILHGEVMTHRKFGRNARSSRAVPVKTMLNEVRNTPFVPWHWGANQSGMQAGGECNEIVKIPEYSLIQKQGDTLFERRDTKLSNREAWLWAAGRAVEAAEAFMNAGYHKQLPNRLLEPFSWIDTLITSTDWANFLWLRDHKDAEPHLQDLARLVKQALSEAEVQELQPGEWHLPYITEEDMKASRLHNSHDPNKRIEWLRKISAARCARISYKPFDGDASYEKELARYDMLVSSDRVHASPLEHQATPDGEVAFSAEFEDGSDQVDTCWDNPHLHGNLEGWIQARKMIPNEAVHD